ncbi:ABC transporter permease [Paenibacillus sp. CN-4]|uniref:ABC transporter permease n=1 Tax=Paenibacillus nanchangensis TaxID=3348343 RepID=UPI00397E2738
MLKLMALEFRKNRIMGMLKGVIIANLAILAFMVLLVFIDQTESQEFKTYKDIFDTLLIFVRATFIVFASVVLSRLVIGEYRSNTITQLFMYPIPRKKIMAAKLLIVGLFAFFSVIVTNLVVGVILVAINKATGHFPGLPDQALLLDQLIKIGLAAILTACMSLIPLYFGLRKKSIQATIVTSIIVTAIVSGDFGSVRMGDFIIVTAVMAVIGLLVGAASLRNIETEDVA